MRPPLTHTLIHPIIRTTVDQTGQEHEEILLEAESVIVVRRPKAKHLRLVDDFDGRPVALAIAMIGKLTNLESEQIENLDPEDFEALGNLLDAATGSGRKTGQTA